MDKKTLAIITGVIVLVSLVVFLVIDLDNDGLTNYQEWSYSTEINNPDTDNDGLIDGQEKSLHSNPHIIDTDGDGLTDGQEGEIGTNPTLIDSDGDKLMDGNSIILSEVDELCQQLKNEQIIYHVKSNGMYEFYGEQYFDSNPSEFSYDALSQIKFLEEISEQEYQLLESQGLLGNCDIDNDNMNNYFEKTVNLPYNKYNGRYAILVDTYQEGNTADCMYSYLTNEQKFKPENVRKLSYKSATIGAFKGAVSDFSKVVDRDSILYVMLEGHGNIDAFSFNDGRGNNWGVGTGVMYEEVGKILEPVKSNVTIISVKACEKIGAINSLKIQSSTYVVVTMGGDFIFGASENYVNAYTGGKQFDPVIRKDYDIDGNGFVSIGESYQTQMKSMERYLQESPEQAQQALKYGSSDLELASKIYLGDFSVRNLLTPDNMLPSWMDY